MHVDLKIYFSGISSRCRDDGSFSVVFDSTHLWGDGCGSSPEPCANVCYWIMFPCLLGQPLAALSQPDTDVHLCALAPRGDNFFVTHHVVDAHDHSFERRTTRNVLDLAPAGKRLLRDLEKDMDALRSLQVNGLPAEIPSKGGGKQEVRATRIDKNPSYFTKCYCFRY